MLFQLLVYGSLPTCVALSVGDVQDDYDIHVVFSTECNMYFDWQTLGLVYSHRKVLTKLTNTPGRETMQLSQLRQG